MQLLNLTPLKTCSFRISFIVILCLLLFSLKVTAQKEADNWYFGDFVGLNFSNGYPVLLTNSAMDSSAGSAVISNPSTGDLMFYTNAEKIWNKNHQVMPNGDSLNGFHNIYQNALIFPAPAAPHKFYVFTLGRADGLDIDTYPFYCKLSYSVVDMRLDNGLGDVIDTVKNIPLADSLTQKLTAIPHQNQNGYWLIAHNMGDNCFQVFLVNEEGISGPTEQCIGSAHGPVNGEMELMQSYGFLKPSPNGEMLAVSISSFPPRPFDLFKFDDATGELSDYLAIGNYTQQFGISFSPDNSKLYLYGIHEKEYNDKNLDRYRSLQQFDVSNFDKQAISNSRIVLNSEHSYSIGDLQIGPDGRVYGTVGDNMETGGEGDDNTIHVINNPNRKGTAANVTSRVFDLKEGQVFGHFFPNFIQSIFNGLEAEDIPIIPDGADPCASEKVVQIFPNPTKDYIQFKVTEGCYQPYSLAIYNVLGQLINKFKVNKRISDRIDVSGFTAGLYFVEIQISNRKIVKKFVKQ